MRVFLTGSTGFIGAKLVPELIGAGHQVLGLTRSDEGARALAEAGAEPHRGDIADLDSLRDGASGCDGVVHTAFDHDFANFAANCRKDARAIEALGSALEGSGRPLVVTSGTAMGAGRPGEPATEDAFDPDSPNPRVASELAGRELSRRGVTVSVVRLSQIHDTRRQGLVTELVALARRTGVSAYAGEGRNRWSAAHVSDAVRLFRLALEAGEAGSRYHATAEEGIALRDIADMIGRALGLPVTERPLEHFGWLAAFVGKDMTASSDATRRRLGWEPAGPGLLDDLARVGESA